MGLLRISFPAIDPETAPVVVVYNPELLQGAVLCQVSALGSAWKTPGSPAPKGRSRRFIAMIESYGFGMQVVSPDQGLRPD